jgi:hypothetical protein
MATSPSSNIIRVNKARGVELVGHVARMGEVRNVYKILVGNPAEKRSLGKPSRSWEDNIKMDLWEIVFGG